MSRILSDTLKQTEVIFGDSLFKLYRFSEPKKEELKASMVPILHSHLFYEIIISSDKKSKIKLKNEVIILTESSSFILTPDKRHCIANGEGESSSSFGLSIEKTEGDFKLYNKVISAFNNKKHQVQALSKKTVEGFVRWNKAPGTSLIDTCSEKAYAYGFLLCFLVDLGALSREKTEYNDNKRSKAEVLLNTLLDENRHSLKEIADAIGYTEKHTLRMIRQKYGLDYRTLKRKKMLEAAEIYLSIEPEMSIEEISKVLGYDTQSSFYSFFKKEKGVTPKQYRDKTKGMKR